MAERVEVNRIFSPDTPSQTVKDWLLDPNVYGLQPDSRVIGYSRGFRNTRKFKPSNSKP